MRPMPTTCLIIHIAGNAKEPLLCLFGAMVLFCTLSGKWWIMAYAFGGIVLFCVVLLYTVYLEYNAQEYLGMPHSKASDLRLSKCQLDSR